MCFFICDMANMRIGLYSCFGALWQPHMYIYIHVLTHYGIHAYSWYIDVCIHYGTMCTRFIILKTSSQ
jgi:hypothetical protein